jgi:hypothetical protein
VEGWFGLPATDSLIRKLGPKFTLSELTDELLFEILGDPRCEDCSWLTAIRDRTLSETNTTTQAKIRVLKALYLVGIIGVKLPDYPNALYSFEQSFSFAPEIVASCSFIVHKMFWSAFNLTNERIATGG